MSDINAVIDRVIVMYGTEQVRARLKVAEEMVQPAEAPIVNRPEIHAAAFRRERLLDFITSHPGQCFRKIQRGMGMPEDEVGRLQGDLKALQDEKKIFVSGRWKVLGREDPRAWSVCGPEELGYGQIQAARSAGAQERRVSILEVLKAGPASTATLRTVLQKRFPGTNFKDPRMQMTLLRDLKAVKAIRTNRGSRAMYSSPAAPTQQPYKKGRRGPAPGNEYKGGPFPRFDGAALAAEALKLFEAADGPLGVQDIAKALKSARYRVEKVVQGMVVGGLIKRHPESNGFKLVPKGMPPTKTNGHGAPASP